MAKIRTSLLHKGVEIPVEVHLERRKTLRAAFGKNRIIVRIPSTLTKEEQRKEYETAKNWIEKTLTKTPVLVEQFVKKTYNSSCINVMGRNFRIEVRANELKACRAKVSNGEVTISLPDSWDEHTRADLIKKTLAKLFAKVYKKQIANEVQRLNDLHFQKEIKNIQLKYNKSNWGSCSSKKNINLSSRLLLVPNEVREYVIIHELAHLTEMNHSQRFWKLVENACPNYKLHEKWLTKKGPSVDF